MTSKILPTIFAESSGKGKAGIKVFRLSGTKSLSILKTLLNAQNAEILPRQMLYGRIYSVNKEVIDNILYCYFKSPASFTGEDIVELYTHGSIAVARILTETLVDLDLQVAEPGEFARRAFYNNKMDLTSAEGLSDLIEAETKLQHRLAIKQAGGELENLYEKWRVQLLKIMSLIEAYIDFPEEDIPDEVLIDTQNIINELVSSFESHLNDNGRGERMRQGIRLSIIGKPNVGKSSLLNFLTQREIAIVSDVAGTTRDIIEGHLDIEGYPVIVQDTAGIRAETNDLIELEGMKRAISAAKNADILLLMQDDRAESSLQDSFKEIINENCIFVFNKIDLFKSKQQSNEEHIYISLKEKLGVDKLLKKIAQKAENLAGLSESPIITRARHRQQVSDALEYLSVFDISGDLVLAAEDIRMTIRALSNLTGKITVDEVLGEIFSNFCIGK